MLGAVKVLSFTHFLQGPSATQILADLGADVIKVEPTTGAFERQWSGGEAFLDGVSVFFLLAGRNQRSLSVDLRSEEGKQIIWKLIERAASLRGKSEGRVLLAFRVRLDRSGPKSTRPRPTSPSYERFGDA